ncbi:hypothetical protein [Streptomyces sp. NPDC046759]|uniref:hypothetical protein n=1 Tax=Streptomyces sp. NPDC046759 TaxID=3155019 RepID=UPI0033F468BD
MSAAAAPVFRPATRADLPAVLAPLADEEVVVDPAAVEVTEAYERAAAAIEEDPRKETRSSATRAPAGSWAVCRRRTSRDSARAVPSGR